MQINLNDAEALVLYELLRRIGKNEECFEDLSEQEVVWTMEAQMEKVLLAPFYENYLDLLAKARETVRKSY